MQMLEVVEDPVRAVTYKRGPDDIQFAAAKMAFLGFQGFFRF